MLVNKRLRVNSWAKTSPWCYSKKGFYLDITRNIWSQVRLLNAVKLVIRYVVLVVVVDRFLENPKQPMS